MTLSSGRADRILPVLGLKFQNEIMREKDIFATVVASERDFFTKKHHGERPCFIGNTAKENSIKELQMEQASGSAPFF